MIPFIMIATVMVVVALALIGVPLIRGRARSAHAARPEMNLSIYRDQFTELEADRARGAISDEQYAENRAELERRVLDEGTGDRDPGVTARSKSGLWTAIVLAGAVPIISVLLYLSWGDPDAFSPLGRAQTAAQDD
ncbi:MAG: c-type cytochrome biogenesis protein CcmI, partial [Burkholderiaceae bacterium]